jgi:hypothetical protein
VVEEQLDKVASSVESTIKYSSGSSYALWPVGNHDLHPATLSDIHKLVGVVPGVCEQCSALRMLEQLIRHRHFMRLTWRYRDVDRPRLGVDERVELG